MSLSNEPLSILLDPRRSELGQRRVLAKLRDQVAVHHLLMLADRGAASLPVDLMYRSHSRAATPKPTTDSSVR